jgi:hypothetical protein
MPIVSAAGISLDTCMCLRQVEHTCFNFMCLQVPRVVVFACEHVLSCL